MKRCFRRSGVLAGAATVFMAGQTHAAVGLLFTDNDSTPTSTSVNRGSTFPVSVKLSETLATDKISGVDYQVQASSNNVFEFLSRNSSVAGDNYNSPNGYSDAALAPVILNPTNGTDLGTSTGSGQGVAGPGTYEVADLSFEVLPNAVPGVYTLSFVATDDAGPPPSYPAGTFATLGTFTVTVGVPEPASAAILGIAGAAVSLRRRRPVVD